MAITSRLETPGFLLLATLLLGGPPHESLAADAALTGAVRVRVHEVTATTLSAPVEVAATVLPFQQATLAAEIQGRVVSRNAEPGTSARAGQRLLGIDASRTAIALRQARMDAAARQVDLARAEHDLKRGAELFGKAVISEDRIEELRFAVDRQRAMLGAADAVVAERERMQADTEISAPFDGVVTDVLVHVGDFVSTGTPVATMADFSRVRVIGGITAVEALRVEEQRRVRLMFADLAGQTYQGELKRIGQVPDPGTGTYPVEVWITAPPDVRMRAGMTATVVIEPSRAGSVLAVPPQALLREGSQSLVYVLDGGVVHKRAVVTGQRTRTAVEIRGGLSAGDRVVTDGQFALREGAAVTVEGR